MEAYFNYVNATQGGVRMADGKVRKIKFTVLDDQYEPARALANAHQLVQQDNVFSLVGTLGQPTNEAIAHYLQPQGIPDPFLFGPTDKTLYAGSSPSSPKPWTTNWQLPLTTEAILYANYLKRTKPNASVAVLYQGDTAGQEVFGEFKNAIKGSGVHVVASQTYDINAPTLGSQVATLAQSKAQVFYVIAAATSAAQAYKQLATTGWNPLKIVISFGASVKGTLVPAGSIANGTISAAFLKDPGDQRFKNDPDVQQFKMILSKYGSGLDASDSLNMWGMGIAESMVKLLQASQPTRSSLNEEQFKLQGVAVPALVNGITLNTTPSDPFPIQAAQLEQYSNGSFKPLGSVDTSAQGQAPKAVVALGQA